MKLLFWLAAVGSIYSYFIYPLILVLTPKKQHRAQRPSESNFLPKLSLIITAHNEQARIRDKLDNSLNIDYPADKREIIVASDCSQDATDQIVSQYQQQGVKLVRAEQHLGKEYAQGLAVAAASGDILVFSDVATQIPADAFYILAEIFSQAQIGAVSSEDRFMSDDGEVVGEGLYVRYEMKLRSLESGLAGLVGLSGSFFAARREVCEDWDIAVPSDFNTALNCRLHGYRAVSDPRLLGLYRDIKNPAKEYQRKLRTIIRGLQALAGKPNVLNLFRFGGFAFQVWSHKVMRWAVPWFMLLVLMASFTLVKSGWVYQLALCVQLGIYGLVLLAFLRPALREKSVFRIPYYFVQVNIAIAHASLLFILGKRITKWQPSER